jgi:surfactin synthase thioesterase subunit
MHDRSFASLDRWVAAERPADPRSLSLFCFPHAGSGAGPFRAWKHLMAPPISLCPLRLPGRENRVGDPPLTSVDALVDALVDVLSPLLDHPYALYGHCFGGIVAYEFAARLHESGLPPPVRLLVASEAAPHRAPRPTRLVHAMTRDELVAHLRWLGGTDPGILDEPELVEVLEPAIRADFQAAETHVHAPRPPLEAPISVFAARDDEIISFDALVAWRELTTGPLTLRTLAGSHMLDGAAWTEVARLTAADLQGDMAARTAPAAAAG